MPLALLRFEIWFAVLLLLETMHVLSPILLAWMHKGFCQIMLQHPRKYIMLPTAIFALAATVSVATAIGWTAYDPSYGPIKAHATGWKNPFPSLFAAYLVWNFYHFSMQNYGVLRLCGVDVGRWGKPVAFLGTAVAIKFMPLMMSVNHWITDIGLSLRVISRKWWFLYILIVLSPVVFLWNFATPDGIGVRRMEGVVIVFVGLRLAIGFVHFLYSRWVWQLSDPQVRATIGRDLFDGNTLAISVIR